MKRIARVLLEVDDDKLKEWAEDSSRDAVIKEIKEETEHGFTDTREKGITIEFIEWENFCPKCEETDLRHIGTGCIGGEIVGYYECVDCSHKFNSKDCQV